ncbi:MAG: PEP-CTERM sorting domain-containing protein [Verrucomicrobiales bacterium]|nr:PEP-CTERM sorting domain-containing protein [Verrucomicrobiales bacterium]
MAMLSQTVTVPLGPDQTFSYDFSIPTIYLMTADFAGVGAGDPVAPVVSYEIDIQLNGLSVWNSTATLEGGLLGRSFTDSGVALVKSPVGDLVNDNEAGYVFSPFSGALSLGTFAGGQSFTVETKLTASLAGGPYELGGLALIGDPANIGSSQFSGSISAVPEPQTYALLGGLGLLGFGVFRRLRR